MPIDERGSTENWTCDPDEPRYCLCNQVSYGSMVACDNEEVTMIIVLIIIIKKSPIFKILHQIQFIHLTLFFYYHFSNLIFNFLQCQFEWFHYGCVGITQPPKGKWFCPPCTVQMKMKNRKEKV